MFERYTESARQSIFFARYEAGALDSPYVESEHLLLGLLRASPFLRKLLGSGAADGLKEAIRRIPREPASSTVDIPLSQLAKRSLSLGAEEAGRRQQREITCEHLFAGLLRLEESFVHKAIRERVGDYDQLQQSIADYLDTVQDHVTPTVTWHPQTQSNWLAELSQVDAVPEFATVHNRLSMLLLQCTGRMNNFDDAYGNAQLRRRPWSRKQALGYLTDQAGQYRLWLARTLTESNLRVDRLPSEESALAQPFNELEWQFVVECWSFANILLLRSIAALPGSKAALSCRVGINAPVSLERLLTNFLEVTEDTMEQVLARL